MNKVGSSCKYKQIHIITRKYTYIIHLTANQNPLTNLTAFTDRVVNTGISLTQAVKDIHAKACVPQNKLLQSENEQLYITSLCVEDMV